eukprot:2783597-Pleurochrysis_carterae.AAC.1
MSEKGMSEKTTRKKEGWGKRIWKKRGNDLKSSEKRACRRANLLLCAHARCREPGECALK